MLGQRADHQRLGQSGHADQKHVASGEYRGEDLVHDLALPNDNLAQFGGQKVAFVSKFVEELRDPVAGG